MNYASVVREFCSNESDSMLNEAMDNFERKRFSTVHIAENLRKKTKVDRYIEQFYSDSDGDIVCLEALDAYESSTDNATSETLSDAEAKAKANLLADSDDEEESSSTHVTTLSDLERDTNELLADLNTECERVAAVSAIGK